MNESNVIPLVERVRHFSDEREWNQFHTPKNLVLALNGEVGELSEVFQWLTDEETIKLSDKQLQRAKEEVADIFLYLLRLCDVLEIDLIDAANKKIDLNEEKYPVNKSKGSCKKYTEL